MIFSRAAFFALVVLAAAGVVLLPLEAELRGAPAEPATRARWLGGGGSSLAVLGGWRGVVANGFWLRATDAWLRHDAARTRAFVALTVATDERPLYFWLNGARILACDLPSWLPAATAEPVRRAAIEEAAQEGLRWLETGVRVRGPHAALFIEMAGIHLNRRRDLAAAADCYRRAAEQPDAPYFAARIHAELLCALGRNAEALVWLKRLLPRLPAGDPAACRDLVAARIRTLEAAAGPARSL